MYIYFLCKSLVLGIYILGGKKKGVCMKLVKLNLFLYAMNMHECDIYIMNMHDCNLFEHI